MAQLIEAYRKWLKCFAKVAPELPMHQGLSQSDNMILLNETARQRFIISFLRRTRDRNYFDLFDVLRLTRTEGAVAPEDPILLFFESLTSIAQLIEDVEPTEDEFLFLDAMNYLYARE